MKKQTPESFYVRDSRTISAAKGRVKRTLSDDLKFYDLTLSCIHGGKNFKPPCMLIVIKWGEGHHCDVTPKGLRPEDQT